MADLSTLTLPQLGWNSFFEDQLTNAERSGAVVGRIFSVQRSGLTIVFEGGTVEIPVGGRWFKLEPQARPTIGDWVVLDAARQSIQRLLERHSVLRRVAVGREREVQLMAANVNTMFLVSSCNEEFNPSRIERYLALALDAGVEPVVVLTKADLAAAADPFVLAVRQLKRDLAVELVDARDEQTLKGVRARCRPGQTVALLGSSGVGKSTLVNTLSGSQIQLTQAAREDDAKGRHTTTGRSLHVLPDGGLLVDNPGMRELLLADVDVTAAHVFDDVDALAAACRFRNCRHESEPGCAVRGAIDSGTLDPRRLDSYRKLAGEGAQRARTLTESRTQTESRGRSETSKRQRHVQDPSEE